VERAAREEGHMPWIERVAQSRNMGNLSSVDALKIAGITGKVGGVWQYELEISS
jgi:hypothetical protein